MCCQAPHSDGLLHPGHLFVTLRAGSTQRPWEVLAVAWDSEGAKVLELWLALRTELSLHGVLQAWIATRRECDGNVHLSNQAASCYLI